LDKLETKRLQRKKWQHTKKRLSVSLNGIRNTEGDRKCTGRRCREDQEAAGKGIERRDIAGSGKVRHCRESQLLQGGSKGSCRYTPYRLHEHKKQEQLKINATYLFQVCHFYPQIVKAFSNGFILFQNLGFLIVFSGIFSLCV
jgi:hypothetical protein